MWRNIYNIHFLHKFSVLSSGQKVEESFHKRFSLIHLELLLLQKSKFFFS